MITFSRDKLRNFISDNILFLKGKIVSFADSDNIFELGLVNSMFAMRLLRYIEKECDFIVDKKDLQASNFSSIDNIMKMVSKKERL